MEHPPSPPHLNPNAFEVHGEAEAQAEGVEQEYDCRYCQKKFSNKQALGGHQNAHRHERAIEKNIRNLPEAHFGYFSGAGLMYGGMGQVMPFLGAHNRPQAYLNQPVYNRPFQAPQRPLQQPGIHFRVNPRPEMQPLPPRVAPPPPPVLPPVSNFFSRTSPIERNAVPFMRPDSSSAVGNQIAMNRQAFGHGSDGSARVCQRREFSAAAQGNDAANTAESEDSGLDLTLKLGI
ncbi:zinc finger protein GIS-like [Andrographis paniculata]|uniref:zinc finger protein GIS-like n=1 Tax=Andrographis paniculata TaxID=175694 RepID=UPI0021E77993|nr:zinc finger protein GIS-like [Andrographis paniculata]